MDGPGASLRGLWLQNINTRMGKFHGTKFVRFARKSGYASFETAVLGISRKVGLWRNSGKLVSLQTFDVVKRFKIAGGYCLVDSLPVVWKELVLR
ncbi:hypothetical protein AVEN_159722-1 [Araneus ventricosus]|uniref:Uncharacterized protein n=1 Tax=Araneus ventricosus TaxID=182803 RepID=A0A4Y2JBG5_ARAVE|nr:hypothetical protein AVEN_159722-1 [Araneus ventricosus]